MTINQVAVKHAPGPILVEATHTTPGQLALEKTETVVTTDVPMAQEFVQHINGTLSLIPISTKIIREQIGTNVSAPIITEYKENYDY